jgi:hypothetical protein
LAVRIQYKNSRDQAGGLLVNRTAQIIQDSRQGRAARDHFENVFFRRQQGF